VPLCRLQPPPQHALGCLRVILTPQPRSPQANHAIIYDTAMLLAVPHTVACELQQLVQVGQHRKHRQHRQHSMHFAAELLLSAQA
jgi:hypothetical protein